MLRAILIVGLFVAVPAHGQVYKCTVAGKTAYSDKPCAVDQKETVLKKPPPTPTPWPVLETYVPTIPGPTPTPTPLPRVVTDDMECEPESADLANFREFDEIVRRFGGVDKIASSTARIGLGPVMLQMENMRAEAGSIGVKSECLRALKGEGLRYMRLAVTSITEFSAQQEIAAGVSRAMALEANTAYSLGKSSIHEVLHPN